MSEIVKEQIIYIRDLGVTNMFDINTVRSIAEGLDFTELVGFIDGSSQRYFNFILKGE